MPSPRPVFRPMRRGPPRRPAVDAAWRRRVATRCQPVPLHSAAMSEVAPDNWQDALTRRLRTLVRLGPLHRIEAVKAHRDDDFADIDLRALCLRALDLTIERMGLGTGMTHEELRDELEPIVGSMRPDLAASERRGIADAVVLDLLNERDRRREFRERYVAFDGERVVHREISLRLLRESELGDGTIVLKATTEAINIYAGMLEYPVEDAQIAEEAVLRSQIHRGLIAEAVKTAQRYRMRSIEYEQKIQSYLETARRDVTQVDWIHEVLTFLAGARAHLEDRQRHDQDLLRSIEVRQDVASDEPTPPSSPRLRDTVEECYRRHMQLHGRIIPANQDYLREQDRQVFRPRLAAARTPTSRPTCSAPALELSTGALAALADGLLARFQPPRPPPQLRLSALIDRLLAPRRAADEAAVTPALADLETIDTDHTYFTPDDQAVVADLLRSLPPGEHTLSAWLAELRADAVAPRLLRLLGLRLLAAYGNPGDALARIAIDVTAAAAASSSTPTSSATTSSSANARTRHP
jgi:hypothetical protein